MNIILKLLMTLLAEIKGMSLIEKALVIGLFIIPIPFTMEGYLMIKGMIKKYRKGLAE